jgi:HD-GYP domain-containing protein (c-di-GMP phosphodiesterase class II)
LSKKDAIREIKRNAGTQFDPDIAKLFVTLIEEAPENHARLFAITGI